MTVTVFDCAFCNINSPPSLCGTCRRVDGWEFRILLGVLTGRGVNFAALSKASAVVVIFNPWYHRTSVDLLKCMSKVFDASVPFPCREQVRSPWIRTERARAGQGSGAAASGASKTLPQLSVSRGSSS